MNRQRKGEPGLTLVELLVVLGIIGIISAVTIPLLARTGFFTSSKADLAARELFTMLRAAKIYATTHNVETALAYGGLLVEDSFSGETVPVIDSVAIVRRLRRDELLLHGFSANDVIFVPLSARAGEFKAFPNGTCILPDAFAIDVETGQFSRTGLTGVSIANLDENVPVEPRLDYNMYDPDDEFDNTFPAHRFSAEGALLPHHGLPQQRLRLRVGLLPDADISDRFFVDPEEAGSLESIAVFFSEAVQFPVLKLADGTPIDIDVEILLYVATGRVKVAS